MPGKGIGACPGVQSDTLAELQKVESDLAKALANAKPKKVSLPTTTMSPLTSSATETGGSNLLKKRRVDDSPIGRAFDLQTREQLDAEIARMFYTGGLRFNLARNPCFMSAFTFAANHQLGGYVPPGYNKLRTSLLQQEKTHVQRLLEPIKSTWWEKGVTIVSDGWSDPQRRPLINIMVVTDSHPMFIKVVDCSGEVKGAKFIAELLRQVICEVGQEKVVQVITDNASTCKAAGDSISCMFPHIYWTPCVVHTLNLALKNICAPKNSEANRETYELCKWITVVHDDMMQIKNFIMNHSMRLAIFSRFSKLKLLSVADTRFASIVVMLKRFQLIRRSLVAMVVSEEWANYKDDDQGKARFVRDTVLNDDWWGIVTYVLDFTVPIYDMIRACDTDKPCLHLVYEMWDSMIEKLKKVIYEHEKKGFGEFSDFYDVVYHILIDRWTKNNTPLQCLAHSLNPRYYSEEWITGVEGRCAPHMDAELSSERIKCLRRMFATEEDQTKTFNEYASFFLKLGAFADPQAIKARGTDDPRMWWGNYGASAPLLQKLAFKLLGQPSSSSCSERNWSTYSFVHSFRRNKLTPQRAEDLVFVHNNLRLLSRSSSQYYDEKTKMWDLGGDDFGTMEETDVLEFANLSLDEPELEAAIFEEPKETET